MDKTDLLKEIQDMAEHQEALGNEDSKTLLMILHKFVHRELEDPQEKCHMVECECPSCGEYFEEPFYV